eukprot:5917424-Prymnesium_polylepis.1
MVTRAAACGTSTSGFLIHSTSSEQRAAMDGLILSRMSSGLRYSNSLHLASSAAGCSAATAWKSSTVMLLLRQSRWSGRASSKPPR